MAYGEIHNSTGTICKATVSCPLEGGHSKDVEEYIHTVASEQGLDEERVRALVSDGTPAVDALAIVRQGLDAQPASARKSVPLTAVPEELAFVRPERTPAIGDYQMTDEKLDIHRVYPGERFYDSEGKAYIVETAQRGHFATLTPIGEDGTVPRPAPGVDGAIRVELDPKSSSFLRKLEKPRDLRYSDGAAGQSESQAIRDLPAEGKWDRSVSAVLNYRDEEGDPKSIELVAPVERLTEKKRIQMGRELFAFSGLDPQRYEDATDEAKLQWINQRIMRREDYRWRTNSDGTVSYSHRQGSGGSYDGKDIKLVEL